MKLLHISDISGYSNDVIRKNFDALIRYNNIWHTGILNFPDFSMSESGRIHFEEVKKVFSVFEYGALILIPLSAVEIIAAKKKRFGSLFAAAGIISVGIPASLGLLIAANWEWVFITFHKLVFQNDYWLFDPYTDPVITILPDEFFMHLCSTYYDSCAGRKSCFFCSMEKTGKEKSKISMCHRASKQRRKMETIKEATGAAILPSRSFI